MRWNAECTIWHKLGDRYITLHYPCWWQDTEAVNITKTGKTDVDTSMIHLPVDSDAAKSDYIAKGNIAFDVAGSVTELLKAHSPLKVTSVSRKDYGSTIMHHTEVTVK